MDTGAIERLGERMRRSGAQEASIAKEADDRTFERQARIEREIDRDPRPRLGLWDRVATSSRQLRLSVPVHSSSSSAD